jgi:hypothetical protein
MVLLWGKYKMYFIFLCSLRTHQIKSKVSMLNIFSLETTRTFPEFNKKIKKIKSLQLFTRVSSLKSLEFQNQAIRMRYFFPKSTSISSFSFPSMAWYFHHPFYYQSPSIYMRLLPHCDWVNYYFNNQANILQEASYNITKCQWYDISINQFMTNRQVFISSYFHIG